jgi:excisionase family DNA binding protein
MLIQFVTVRVAADFLGCSTRRVRALLAQGRLRGLRVKGRSWEVFWPLFVTPGRRGPDLRRYPVRKVLKAKGRSGMSLV